MDRIPEPLSDPPRIGWTFRANNSFDVEAVKSWAFDSAEYLRSQAS
jgi:hypothetical protein